MANGSVPKQIVTISLQHGSWRVVVDDEYVGTFEGSWSGEVESKIEVTRSDAGEHEERLAA